MTGRRPREAVLLLHGIWVNRLAMQYHAMRLRREGFLASSPDYRSVRGPLEEHIALVARRIASIDTATVHLVGHSMGGVVLLRYLQHQPDPRIGRSVLLGAPVTGSRAARSFALLPGGDLLLGRSESIWHSDFNPALPSGLAVGAIAGNRPIGLGKAILRIPGTGDGVVLVEETRLPGLADHIVLPVCHTGMLFSPQVARQIVCFLRQGRFSR